MAQATGFGDLISGLGDVQPSTVELLHERNRMQLEEARQKAIDEYNKSMLGMASARMSEAQRRTGLEEQRVGLERQRVGLEERRTAATEGKPITNKYGQILRTNPTTGQQEWYSPPGLAPQQLPYAAPGGPREQALKLAPNIMSGPWNETEKLRRLMEAGLNAADAKAYMDQHKEAFNLSKRAEAAYERKNLGKPLPGDDAIIKAYSEFRTAGTEASTKGGILAKDELKGLLAGVATAVATAQAGEGFAGWDQREKEKAYLDKYYLMRDPRFAWGDKRSYNEFQHGYYKWMADTGRDPLTAIGERADIKSWQGALNDVTRRLGLINTFVDRIEENSTVLKDLLKQYPQDSGRLINEAQNMIRRGVTGSGLLESVRLTLFSISREVTKVETGQLGIAAPSVTEAAEISKIHDINLNPRDLLQVIDTSLRLGYTSKKAMERTREDLRRNLSEVGPYKPPVVSPSVEVPAEVLKLLPPPSGLRDGRTAGNGKYIIKGGQWRMNQ